MAMSSKVRAGLYPCANHPASNVAALALRDHGDTRRPEQGARGLKKTLELGCISRHSEKNIPLASFRGGYASSGPSDNAIGRWPFVRRPFPYRTNPSATLDEIRARTG